jgi:precorrin-2 methylase
MKTYQRLAEEVEEKADIEVKIIPVIVSSLGAVYSKTMMALKKLLM